MKQRTILYISSTLDRSSTTRVMYNLVKYLNRASFAPRILTLSPEPALSDYAHFVELGIPVDSLSLTRIQGLFTLNQAINAYIASHDITLVHTNCLRADSWLPSRPRTVKAVTTVHSIPDEDYRMSYGGLLGSLLARTHQQAFGHADAVIAVSSTVARRLQARGIDAVYACNGVDAALFTPAAQEAKQTLREQLHLPQDAVIAISVGHLTPLKDPLTVIKGFTGSRMAAGGQLILLGDGPLYAACSALPAVRAGKVQLLGVRTNVVDYLQAADYFISASHSEGMPYSVLEALACGVPVCLSDIDSHQEIIELGGKSGVTFPVGDVGALAASLDNLLQQEHAALSEAARQSVDTHLSARKMAEGYEAIYHQLTE